MRYDSFQLVQRAWAAYQAKHYDLAEQEALGALALAPNDPEALSILSICATERKDHATAVQFAEQAVTHSADAAIYHYRLALVHGRFGDHKAPEPPLKRALELDPAFAPAYSLYAWVQFARFRFKEAVRAIDQALQIDPNDQQALSLRILVFESRGDRKRAGKAAMEALSVDPENIQAHSTVGNHELRASKHESAAAHFKTVLSLSPHLPSIQLAYAQAVERQSGVRRTLLEAHRVFTQPILTPFWPFCWILYLMSLEFEGHLFTWPWVGAAMAFAFHGLLIWAWWGPLASYALLRHEPELQRIVSAKWQPLDRARLSLWHLPMSAAIALSTVSLVIPGNSFPEVVGVLASAGLLVLLVRLAIENVRATIIVAIVVLVAVAAGAIGANCLTSLLRQS